MRTALKRSPVRALASALVGVVIAGLAVVGVAVPAQAAEGDVTAARLDWGVRAGWRDYIGGRVAGPNSGGGTSYTAPASDSPQPYRWDTAGTGTFDPSTGAGTISFSGGVRWTFPTHGIDARLSDLQLVLDGDGTGELSGSYSDPVRGIPETTGLFATLSGVSLSAAAGSASLTANAAVAAGASTLFGSYAVGEPMDALSASFSYELPAPVATATTTTLTASPAGTAQHGESVALTATISPAAAGGVEFFDGSSSLGSATVSGGTAVITRNDLAVGAHSLRAVFTPADSASYSASSSEPLSLTVFAPSPDAVSTSTTVAVTPTAPVALSSPVTVTATVTPGSASGTVELFETSAVSGAETSLGSVAVAGGTATVTTSALGAGGHSFRAVFTPADPSAFTSSSGAATANYGVVDPSAPTACTPQAPLRSSTGATAAWAFSEYSYSGYMPWAKTAGEGVSVSLDGRTFQFAGGTVAADASCAVVSFPGWFQIEPHAGFWVRFTSPVLSVSASGDGVWSAEVTTSEDASPRSLVFASFHGASGIAPATAVSTTITPDYAGTTASGTWSAGFDSAWPNALVLAVPSALRAYFYQSSSTGLNLTKPPAPLQLAFDWPDGLATTTALTVSPASPVTEGTPVTLTAHTSPAGASGTVEFFDGTTSLGSAPLSAGSASLGPIGALAAGEHTVTAVFTPVSAAYLTSTSPAVPLSVVASAQPAVCVASLEWGVRASFLSYLGSPFAAGSVQTIGSTTRLDGVFHWTGGSGSAEADGTSAEAAFTEQNGVHFTAHDGVLDLAFSNPRIVVTSASSAQLYLDVTGRQFVDTTTPGPSFSQRGVHFADLVLGAPVVTAASVSWTAAAATMTDAGLAAFGGFYGPGNAGLDPLSFTIPLAGATACGPGTDPAGPGGGDGGNGPAGPGGGSGPGEGGSGQVTVTGQDGASPLALRPGTAVTFAAAGFDPGARVSVVVHSEPVELGVFTADGSGVVQLSWTIPSDFEPGAHTVVFTDTVTGRTVSGGFTVLPAQTETQTAQCVALSVDGGSLQWGIRSSFVSYVTGPIAKGSVTVSGVSQSGGSFAWSEGSGSYNPAAAIGSARFGGSVQFSGHSGLLELSLRNPRVAITSSTSGVLYADVSGREFAGTTSAGPTFSRTGVPIATLSFDGVGGGSAVSVSGARATLTTAGAEAFGGFYSAGEALDPVSFTLPLGAPVPCDSSTDPQLALTGADATPLLLGLALAALMAGGGLLVVRRRTAGRRQ